MGDTEGARAALQRAASTASDFPGKEEVQRRLALLGGGAGKSRELSTEELEGMLKQQPNDIIARMRLGEAYEKQRDFAKAAADYEEALKENSKLLPAAIKLARLNAGPLSNKEKALEFAKKARDLAPADPRVAGILGGIAYQTGNFSWAYSLLQESSRQVTDDAAILHDYAWAAYTLGKVGEARQIMQKVLKIGPESPQSKDAKSFLSITAADQSPQELAAAEPEVQKILETDPNYLPALVAKADLQVRHGNSKTATNSYADILRRYPDFAPAQKRLASLYAENPETLGKAYDLAMKARQNLPDDPELSKILAEISYKRKEFAYAIHLFQETGRRTALDPKSLYYLGMSQWQATQKTQGRQSLEQALGAGLPEPLAAEARRVLAESVPK
jgi:tetratricopeptide (TPR) repeat protein